MRGRFVAAGAIVAMVLLLAACGSDESENAGMDASGNCKTPEKFVFSLAVPYSFSTPLYAIAKEKGWYEDECLDVSFTQGSGSQNLVQLLGSGAANFGEGDALSMISGQAGGANLMVVGRNTQTNQFALLVDDAKLTTAQKEQKPFDLKNLYGMTYGATESGSSDLMLTYLMKTNDIDRNKIPRVSIPLPGLAPLVTGQVDFVANTAPQAPLVEFEGKKVHIVTASDVGLNALGYVYGGNADYLESHGDQVKRFLKATAKAMDYAPEHAEEAAAALCKIAPELCSAGKEKILVQQFKQYADYKAPDGTFMCIDDSAWEGTKELVKNTSLQADKIPDVSKAKYTNEYLSGC